MRKLHLVVFLLSLLVAIPAAAQGGKITMTFHEEPLPTVFSRLEKASGYKFSYAYDDVQGFRVSASVKNQDINGAMQTVLRGLPLRFSVSGKVVNIARAKQVPVRQQGHDVRGTIVDEDGEPVIGATVRSQGGQATVTDVDGHFSLPTAGGQMLKISYVGKNDISTVASDGMRVVMRTNAHELSGVVVTGIFARKEEGFTGSAHRMTGDDIRKLSSGNILNAITMMDPGFRQGSNMMSGSNPSSLPDYSMRGQSSMGDYSTDETVIMRGDIDTRPNQPLFVLDGIIGVSVTKIMDLDPAQIASVTLLKDAAAMAIYGSEASNGVVVVETLAPSAGKLRVTYNGNYKVEYPDLTDYHLLNAADKLELERRAGYYDETGSLQQQKNASDTYRAKYLEVLRGVNTYWLSQPVHTVFAQRHGINLEGGTNELRYKLYGGINRQPGVMKETGVDGTSFSLDLRYRYKGLLISNIAYVDYTKSDRTSPYGTFDQYAMLNPYYRIYDANGQIAQYLEHSITTTDRTFSTVGANVGNPMYNTLYNTFDKNTAFEIRDAFRAEYTPIDNLRLAVDMTITKTSSDLDAFKSANHTDFLSVSDINQRGSYRYSHSTSTGWDLAFTANYNKVWQNRHVLATYFRYNVKETKTHMVGVYTTGFPNEDMDEVYLGAKVQSASGDEGTSRSFGGVATVSYTYDQRYAADLNGRMDASSQFGRNNRYAPFWSAGLRWNLDKESFIKKLRTFDQLVLRATYGLTGTQGFSPYQALQMYTYSNTMRIYQSSDVVGAMLYGMGNPDLKWQTTKAWNFGFDFAMLRNRISGRFEYYRKLTENTVLDYSLAPSVGFTSVKENIGNIANNGYEFSLRVMPIYIPAKQMNLSITANGSHNENEIKRISNAMRIRNQQQLQEDPSNPNKLSRPLPRYEEGYSQSMIWAVRSLGIDPITGREIYLTRNGERTSEYNVADQVPVGDTEPTLQGTLGINFNWYGLSISVAAQYHFGGDYYNRTLVDKVENADLHYNVDRRAFYDRWMQPGDIARFKAVTQAVNGSETKATTRFLMNDNQLSLNTVNIQYRFERRYDKWLSRFGLSSASVGLYLEDLFHWSTIKQERGIQYPMSRQVSMSLNLTF